MSGTAYPTEHWKPTSEADRELVRKELDAIASSHQFRSSKRYPALLRYLVDAALDGRGDHLKERTLGVAVFGRDPDYDTNASPVVRFSAGEVRKRLAQYYYDSGRDARLQIELPVGSYVPEFMLRDPETPEAMASPHPGPLGTDRSPSIAVLHRYRIAVLSVAALLAAAVVFGVYSYHRSVSAGSSAMVKLWQPFLNPAEPILIVVGTGHRTVSTNPETAQTTFFDHITGPSHHVSLATATALANLAGVLRQNGGAYEIKEDTETSLTDMHSRTLILIGATNNAWTMRLISPLRFSFTPGPMAQILDAKNPRNSDWSIDFSKPYSSISTDYAIVARYYDPTTESPVMVIAGIGPYGTEAASAFVSSPHDLEQIVKQAPPGWEKKNLEMVIRSEVIDGKAGPPVLVSSTVW